MKKAKRLIAIILAVVMIASASSLPVYARIGGAGGSSDYRNYGTDSSGKYYFTAEQGATYILDMVDNMLAEENIVIYIDQKLDDDGLLPHGSLNPLGLANFWGTEYYDYGYDGILYLTSVDNCILEVRKLLKCLQGSTAGDLDNLLGNVGEILDSNVYLDEAKIRGEAPLYQNGVSDIDVLFNVLDWICSLKKSLVKLASGKFSLGSIIEGFLDDEILDILHDPAGFVKDTVYSSLVDDAADAIPDGMTVDQAIQKVVDWALISGTGVTAETGANSVLGENAEAILPAIADQPGQASIGSEEIQADHDGDGVAETHNMSFYQLVSNAIQALLNGMLKDLLTDVLYDALDVDPTVNDGKGDPELMSDVMFNTIVGAVEGLCVQNGAPAVEYTEEAQLYPVPKIDCLLDWFFMPNGGLATLIRFDYSGIHITDNFMSLLNDVARLDPGLLGRLLEMELPESIVYSADELNAVKYVNHSYQICEADDPDVMDQAYLSYEKDENGNQYELYVSEYKVENDVKVPVSYGYVGSGSPVNTIDASRADYINPTFIRSDYVVTTPQVWACLLKVLLNDMIDGCYFPEWADTISSAGAYALASMAAVVLPEENFIERLDRYHYEVELGQTYQFKNPDKAYSALAYEEIKADPTGKTGAVSIPKAALDIGSSIGAFYLNGVFNFNGRNLTVHNTTFEQFLSELVIWLFSTYFPVFFGTYNTSTGYYSDGAFSTQVNNLVNKMYSDPKNGTIKSDAEFDYIYTFLNETVFGIIPEDWFPTQFASSFGFIDGWLINSIKDLDIQQIFSLLSVNPTGELNKSVANVLINIIARLFGVVFGGSPILQANDGTNVFSTSPTVVTSFEQLLSTDSLAALVGNLLDAISNNGRILCETAFPLLLSVDFVPEFDEGIFGTDLTTFKIGDLEDYVNYLGKDVNGTKQSGDVYFEKEKTAKSAAETLNVGYVEVPQGDGTVLYKVTFPDSYNKKNDAERAAKYFDNGYVTSYEVDGEEVFYVYASRDYLKSATRSADLTDASGKYHTYSNFNYAALTGVRSSSNPLVSYDSSYRFFEAEDFSSALFNYNNFQSTLDDAEGFIGKYEEIATNDLPAAYSAWVRYSVQARLASAGLYDANDDGVADMKDTDDDGTLDTYIRPSIPSEMYPFYTADSAEWKYYDEDNQGVIGRLTSVNKNEFTTVNYEVLQMAVEFANDPENVIVLPDNQAEEVVRLALNTLAFDITPNSNGTYTGSLQWNSLSSAQINTINAFCADNGYTLVNEDGVYTITRKPFDFINSTWSFGLSGQNINPVLETRVTKNQTDVQKLNYAIVDAYDKYVTKMRHSRLSLYNYLNEIGKRVEATENGRNATVDISSLVWAKKYTESAYINPSSNLRNQKIAGVVNGEFTYSKIYTSASYQKFQEAYDFAVSVLNLATGAASAGGLTQSIISRAYMGLISAYQSLASFSGEADWAQLDKYIALAKSLVDGYSADDANGYTAESYTDLVTELSIAIDIRDNSGYDCESQDIVDSEVDDLFQAISSLVYKVQPNLIPSDGSNVEFLITNPGARIVGQVFNLTEGVGLTKELVKLVGMYEDYENGKTMEIKPSSHGNGTGAYYQALDGQTQKFYYVAVLFGDINGDTRIDGTDKSSVNYYLVTGQNTRDAMGDAKYEAADVDHDGDVDENDAQLIESHYNYTYTIDQSNHSSQA